MNQPTDSELKDLCLSPGSSIREALSAIDCNTKGIVMVVDEQRRLIDTVNDGDIRRAVLAGLDLDSPVTILKERKSHSPHRQPLTAPVEADKAALLDLMRRDGLRQIPLIDQDRRVVGLVTMRDLLAAKELRLQAVVMAGGAGKRLRPLTEKTPKPMLSVGGKPLLEQVIGRLAGAGVKRVSLTTHYKAEVIEEHFGDGSQFGVDIRYINETSPLGTAGALSLLPAANEPLLVINGDILTEVDFGAMLDFHHDNRADMTVGVRDYELKVPFGVIETDGSRVIGVSEKPVIRHFINAGVYLLSPEVSQLVPADRRFDMTDLIDHLLELGRRVVSFPIIEYWLDIGQQADYEQAQMDIKEKEGAS